VTDGWTSGNSVILLENGEEFFPRIFFAIKNAKYEVLVETFILRNDKVGRQVKSDLISAARRGVRVSLTVDGYGSYYLPEDFIQEITDAGILFCMYDPPPKWMSYRTNLFRRLHRKLLVVDGHTAFVGGINLSHNHLADYGPKGKQDYAVEICGPIAKRVRDFAMQQVCTHHGLTVGFPDIPPMSPGTSENSTTRILFVTRDNQDNRTAIENEYLKRIASAQSRITIANAYFFPGYRLLRELRNAARRGVQVQLIIQGTPGSTLAMKAVPTLYDFLVESNIEVCEYWERPFHGKIATIDDDWSTVGSTNLDPLSLSLNLEANVIIIDREFNSLLTERMVALIQQSNIRKINDSWIHRRTLWKWFRSLLVFHFLRHFPAWAGWLPAHSPRIRTTTEDSAQTTDCTNTHENY
jgi:cardiolipin synthase